MNPFAYNYHTHTYRCGHASGSDEDYVKAAIEAGYRTLGFSDHAPYRDYPLRGTHMDFDQLEGYVESIRGLKERYKDIIDIRLGLESEYYDYCHDEKVYLLTKVDYLILGQHFSDPQARGANYFRENTEEQILEYAESICKGLDTGLFSYLCHPDVILNKQQRFTKACEEAAHMIGKKASELDIPVEMNIHGIMRGRYDFGNGVEYYYPNRSFWKILASYPIRVVLGVDAHDPRQLLDMESIEQGLKALNGLDIDFIYDPFL